MKPRWVCLLLTTLIVIYLEPTLAQLNRNCEKKPGLSPDRCTKKCESDADCVSAKKKCLCDGDCGKSCINPNIRCSNINSPFQNGKVNIIPFNKFGAVAKYWCILGYELHGVPARVCQGDESWSGQEPKCVLDTDIKTHECGAPPTVHNAHHDKPPNQKSFVQGVMLQYGCNEGFTSRKDSVIRAWCVGGGIWVGPNLNCANAGCPLLPPIGNGQVDSKAGQNLAGSVAYYSCNEGFYLNGRADRTCMTDDTWNGTEPSCEKVTCGDPPEVENASHDAPRDLIFHAGTQLQYSCSYGFHYDLKEDYTKAMCNGDGKWIGPRMTCTAKNCGDPGDISNGWRDGYKTMYPHRVTFHCDEGFELNGKSQRRCQANGMWSEELPKCTPITCIPQRPPLHGTMVGSGVTYNSVVRFTCDVGYKVIGSAERKCESDGLWSGQTPYCEEINCGIPEPLWNGYLDGHSTAVGSVYFFRCNVRTTFDGQSFNTQCLDNGRWSSAPPRCLGQCQVPEIENGNVMEGRAGSWVDYSTIINFRCNQGLVLNDTNEVRCDNGTWSLIPRCVAAPCRSPPPHVPNGRRIFITNRHGARAKYSCFQGYRLRGDKYRKCEYGRWIGMEAKCVEKYCPNPGKIAHGITYKKGQQGKFLFKKYIVTIRHGEKLEYECNPDYVLKGSPGKTCVDGTWRPQQDSVCEPSKHMKLQKYWKPLEETGH